MKKQEEAERAKEEETPGKHEEELDTREDGGAEEKNGEMAR